MSTGAHVAVIERGRMRRARTGVDPRHVERTGVRLSAFAALGLYGVLRWGTMVSPAPVWRLLGLLAVALILAGPVTALRARNRPLAILAASIATLAVLPLAGLPLAWVVHVRIAVSADAVGQGLSALPNVLVPYTGINDWVRVVIVLGAGVLLVDAGLMLSFAPSSLGELRRAAAALPLVVLAVVPSTLARPQLPYLQGLVLFALLALFIWGERVRRYDVPLVIGIGGLAAAAAMIAAPALDPHSPWINYRALAGTLSPGHLETFDWSQRYGPLNWPRNGRVVLDVQAQHPDYWKAEDLDLFNGTGWTQGSVQPASQEPQPDPAVRARWMQTITVTIRAMQTSDIIAAGFASAPVHLSRIVVPAQGAGTWTAGADLQPGDSYSVSTYSPAPTMAELSTAGPQPPEQLLAGYRTILLPQSGSSPTLPEIVFPQFHSGLPPQSVIGIDGADGTAVMRSSPYGRAFALAQTLASRAATPAAFVASVQRYLAHGYTYSENPPRSRYPLETFLFTDKTGYCQQFSGAMALLLRMGGIPARVGAGFTSGTQDAATHRWLVSDLNAHAWVEAWFPRYGWVRFDPTPAAAPARGGHVGLPALYGTAGAAAPAPTLGHKDLPATPTAGKTKVRSGGTPAALILAAIALLLALLTVAVRAVRRRDPSGEELVAELERALARCGRPLSGGVTLATLEHRFRSSPDAAGYIRAIRVARFGGGNQPPTQAQRRALRAQLRAGLGGLGYLRAAWALPPRWRAVRSAWNASSRGIHS